MAKLIRKRCQKCGWVGATKPRERRCKQPAFGTGSYACWGQLTVVPVPTVLGAPPTATTRPQDVAAAKLQHAWQMVDTKTKALVRLAASLREWTKKADYYAQRANLTDAEIAARKAQALEQRARRRAKRPTRRGIILKRAADQ